MTASNQAQREWIIHHQVNKEFLATCTQRRPGPAWITIYNSSLRGPAAPHGTKFPTFIHLWGRRWPCHHPPANTGSTRQAPDTAIVDSTNTSTNLSCISVLKAFQMFCLTFLSPWWASAQCYSSLSWFSLRCPAQLPEHRFLFCVLIACSRFWFCCHFPLTFQEGIKDIFVVSCNPNFWH